MNVLVFFIMSSYEEETKKLKNPYHTTLKQYASVSTAHGISYIFEDGRFFIERIIWAAVVVAALAFAICMSISAFHNWKDNPVLTSVKTTGLPIEKIEFPYSLSKRKDAPSFPAKVVQFPLCLGKFNFYLIYLFN